MVRSPVSVLTRVTIVPESTIVLRSRRRHPCRHPSRPDALGSTSRVKVISGIICPLEAAIGTLAGYVLPIHTGFAHFVEVSPRY